MKLKYEILPTTSGWKTQRLLIPLDVNQLNSGHPLFIGRSKEHGITDTRCSRKQVEIIPVEGERKVIIKQLGPNPSFIKPRGKKEPMPLLQGESAQLEDGDDFSLLVDLYNFTVTIDEIAEKPQESKDSKGSKDSKEQPSKKHKRDDDDEDDIKWSVASGSKKKQKKSHDDSDGSVSGDDADYVPPGKTRNDLLLNPENKPLCRYGENCYRKNPQHLEEFFHPPKPTKPQKSAPSQSTKQKDESKPTPTPAAARKYSFDEDSNKNGKEPELPLYQIPRSVSSSGSQAKSQGDSPKKSLSIVPSSVPTPPVTSAKRPDKRVDSDDDLLDLIAPTKSKQSPPSKPSTSTATTTKPPRNIFLEDDEDDLQHKYKGKQMDTTNDQGNNVDGASQVFHLAFPSYSTLYGNFDKVEATTVAKEAIEEFLKKHTHQNIKLTMVIDPEEPENYAIMKNQHIQDPRFNLMLGDLSRIRSKHEIQDCGYVGNEATWRLKETGPNVNRRLHQAAGPVLLEETKKLYQAGQLAVAHPVKLPSDCALTLHEGIHHVIHMVSPNMDPKHANLIEDPSNGPVILKQTYDELFACFFNLTGLSKNPVGNQSTSKANNPYSSTSAPASSSSRPMQQFPNAKDAGNSSSGSKGGWANGLLPYILHPERQGSSVFQYDADTVIIHDKYPKAKKHFLVLPRKEVDGLDVLKPSDIPMLENLHNHAKSISQELEKEDSTLSFKIGYHAIPSMRQLHLHLISHDFCAEGLKTKKHWNSFNSPYFVSHQQIVDMLKRDGKIKFDKVKYEAYLEGPLICHFCNEELKTVPKLKQHLVEHFR